MKKLYLLKKSNLNEILLAQITHWSKWHISGDPAFVDLAWLVAGLIGAAFLITGLWKVLRGARDIGVSGFFVCRRSDRHRIALPKGWATV